MARQKKEKKVPTKLEDFVLPSDPSSRTAIANAVNEIVDSLIRRQAESDFINEVANRMQEELDVPKKFTKNLAKHQYKSNLKEFEAETDVLSSSADVLAGYGLKTGV
jgi:hypothetical protein